MGPVQLFARWRRAGGAVTIILLLGTKALAQQPNQCGRVVAASCDSSGAATLLVRDPRGGNFWVIIDPRLRSEIAGPIEEQFEQRDVCVSPQRPSYSARVTVQDLTDIQVGARNEPAVVAGRDVARSCDPGVSLPVLVRATNPQFTADAMRTKVRGRVVVQGTVDRNGRVKDARVVQPLEASLEHEALEAFAKWNFRPGTRGGIPVDVRVTVEMAFTLR